MVRDFSVFQNLGCNSHGVANIRYLHKWKQYYLLYCTLSICSKMDVVDTQMAWTQHVQCGQKHWPVFSAVYVEWGQLWKSTKWGNKEPPPACCRVGITPFSTISGIFFSRSIPWLWLWHKANAWAYDVNKHLHCRHVFLVWMAEMAVGEQRKEVMPQFLWLQPSLYEHVKENCPGVIRMSLSDVATMLTILLCLSCWICSKIPTASGEKLATPSP